MNLKFTLYIGTLSLLMIIIPLSGCGDSSEPPSSTVNNDMIDSLLTDPSGADQVTTQAHIYLYKAGHKTTDLLADTMRKFTKLDSTIAINLDIDFFDSTGAKISNLIAETGYIRERDQFLTVTGGVVVTKKEESVVLLTEYLEWDAANEKVLTDSFVTVIREADTLYSYGLETDPGLDSISFKNRVSGRISNIEKVKE